MKESENNIRELIMSKKMGQNTISWSERAVIMLIL